MAARTYLPTFRRILHRALTYTSAYQTILYDHMTTDQATKFTAFLEKLNDMVSALGPEPVQN